MAEPLGLRCAAESLARGEPQIGTASRVQRWFVVEQPGAWGAEALHESRLDPEIGAALEDSGRRHRVRVLLARRPGDRGQTGERQVFLAHSGAERRWLERLRVPMGDPAALLGIDLGLLAFPDPPGLGDPGPAGLHLVCTNGRHDPCCADLGRPVVRALVDAASPDVWECAHVGGDRFAANVVCLPDGVYYGRVEPPSAARLLADHRAGVLDLDHYRGRSCYAPLVQAAEYFARRHLDERRLDGVSVLSAEPGPEGTVAVLVQQRDGATVEVVVRRERAAPAQLTCHVHQDGTPWRYLLVEVRAA
jgi:Sucrase/ferredoxin-like